MALLTSSMPRMDMTDIPRAVRRLTDYVYQLREELEYVAMNLDSDNVTEILTNITKVKSEDGTTEIVGNTLKQTDTKKTRLIMGYDKVHKQFKFEMYDPNQVKTIYMDEDGQIRLSGKPLLTMHDEQNVLRAKLGYDKELKQFVFELNNAEGAHAIYLDDNGEAVFAGSINTSKNAIVGNNLYLGGASPDTPKMIRFNEGASISSNSRNIIISAQDTSIDSLSAGNLAVAYSASFNGPVYGLDAAGYATKQYVNDKINDLKAWVEENFVHV